MVGIDLCLMVRNEEKYIERCLRSVCNYVTNIYILDTGSIDSTINIAKQYTKNVYFKEFNGHFAQMRHEVMREAKSEWILFLDGDEYFTNYDIEYVIEFIQNVSQSVGGIKFCRYNFFPNGGWYSDYVVKLFRNHKGFKYDKNVTEKIETSINEKGYEILDTGVILNHTGHSKNRFSRDKKTSMYLDLLKEQLFITPEDALLHSYIGINSGNIGDIETAMRETKIGVEMNPNGIVNHVFYGNILRAANKPNEALQEYKMALLLDNKVNGRILNLIGVTYLSMKNFIEAKKHLEYAYEHNKVLVHILLNLGLVNFFIGDYEEALKCFNAVIQRNDSFMNIELDTLLETNYCDCLSYETISNYAGLRYYVYACKINLSEKQ